jgi:hypothetical protein
MMKKLYISVFVLCLGFIIFGTVTYAWITISTVNNIEGLYLSASTGDELEISLDGFNFSQTLDTESLEALIASQSLSDVTTLDGIHFYTGGLRPLDDAYPNRDYLSFELWFRSVEKQRNVYLIHNVSDQASYDVSIDGTYVVSKGIEWEANIDFQNGSQLTDMVHKGDKHIYYAKNAIRIGFQELLDQPYDQRNEEDLNHFIFDPSNDPLRGYAMPYGAYNYFLNTAHNTIVLPEQIPNTIYELSKPLEDNPYIADNQNSLITNLQSTGLYNQDGIEVYQSKVRVNIWIEGWDADAFDAILKDFIKIQLQFKSMNAYGNYI